MGRIAAQDSGRPLNEPRLKRLNATSSPIESPGENAAVRASKGSIMCAIQCVVSVSGRERQTCSCHQPQSDNESPPYA